MPTYSTINVCRVEAGSVRRTTIVRKLVTVPFILHIYYVPGTVPVFEDDRKMIPGLEPLEFDGNGIHYVQNFMRTIQTEDCR